MADLLKFKPGIRAKRILVKCSATVPNVIKSDLVNFNNRLLEEGLVPEGVYNPDDRIWTSAESATKIYQACMATVEHNPSKFSALMAILSEYQPLEGAVDEMTARAMKAELMAPSSAPVQREVYHGGAQPRKRGVEQTAPETILTTGHMKAVMDELRGFAEWRVLGRNLGVDEGQLGIFEEDASKAYGRLSKVIDHWLKRNHNEEEFGPPTWRNLAKAVEPIDNALALKIEAKHGICRETAEEQPLARQPTPPRPVASIAEQQVRVTERRPIQPPPSVVEEKVHVSPRQPGPQPSSTGIADSQRPAIEIRPRPQPPSTYLPRTLACLSITVVLVAVATWYIGGGVWFGIASPSTPPPSSSFGLTCDWPKPNSRPVQLQEKQIKTELGVEEMSDNLKTSVERVRKALIAGEKCKDPELNDKMNMVDTTVRKIDEKVDEIYGVFNTGAEEALTDLRSMWDFVVKGKMDKAMRWMKSVFDITESLAVQLDSLKGSMQSKRNELRRALDNLRIYREKAKDNHESQQHKLREEKQRREGELSTAASLAREAEEKARSAAVNAQRETEAWDELQAINVALGNYKAFEKRRAQFLKIQQTSEAEAEDSRRIMEQTRLKIAAIEQANESANVAFKCISDAITKMQEAAGSVSMPIVCESLFEESLKKECTDLHEEIKSIKSLGDAQGSCPSQVCDKAQKLYAKWQALSKISSDYFSSGNL